MQRYLIAFIALVCSYHIISYQTYYTYYISVFLKKIIFHGNY